MQRNLFIKSICFSFVAVFMTAFLVSCDKMDQPFVTAPVIVDTAACPVPEFPAITNHLKRVLLEDYTGHTCPNCPTAGKLAGELKDQYGDRLVVMAIHAGWYANTYPEPGTTSLYSYDFRTEAGNAWDTKFGNSAAGNPNGMVDRQFINGKYPLSTGEWSGKVSEALNKEPSMDLQVITDYEAATRKVCVHTQSTFLKTLDLNLKLEVVLIEDSIIATQKNNDPDIGPVGDIQNFVHMHVMRGAINGTWGSELALVGVANPEKVIKTFQWALPEKCVAKNCHIVAFIFNKDTYEVLQAAEADLTDE